MRIRRIRALVLLYQWGGSWNLGVQREDWNSWAWLGQSCPNHNFLVWFYSDLNYTFQSDKVWIEQLCAPHRPYFYFFNLWLDTVKAGLHWHFLFKTPNASEVIAFVWLWSNNFFSIIVPLIVLHTRENDFTFSNLMAETILLSNIVVLFGLYSSARYRKRLFCIIYIFC